jgi:hypothetical protein
MPFTENLPRDDNAGQREGRVLIVCGDLFFGTQITSLVRQAGFEPALEMTPARALGQLHDSDVVGVILDLETPGLDVGAVIAGLPGTADRPRVVAFGPHVYTAKLEAARAAGCDAVLTRGQISSGAMVIREALSGPAAGGDSGAETE